MIWTKLPLKLSVVGVRCTVMCLSNSEERPARPRHWSSVCITVLPASEETVEWRVSATGDHGRTGLRMEPPSVKEKEGVQRNKQRKYTSRPWKQCGRLSDCKAQAGHH